MDLRRSSFAIAAVVVSALTTPAFADFLTAEPAQLRGDTPSTSHGFTALPLVTIGDSVEGYRPVGIFDGIGALRWSTNSVRVFTNHELGNTTGNLYTLANGTTLRGARVSYFDLHRVSRRVLGGGLAYDTIIDRAGAVVTSATQINEGTSTTEGFDRFCSSNLFTKGQYGLVDDIYFCGEETGSGQECALDVRNRTLYIVPALARQAWESVTFLQHPDANKVAILTGDDSQSAPLWLYIGAKNALGNGSFLDRNGLARGTLWVWKADNGDLTPQQFHGTGAERSGSFVELDNYQPSLAGTPGWDSLGYATEANLDAQTIALGAFRFSRPEDVTTSPKNGLKYAFVTTGRGSAYPLENWGDTYIATVDFSGTYPTSTIRLVYDGDDAGAGQFAGPDFGLRSPDNLDWSDDGFIYITEDRSTTPLTIFGAVSGADASLWKLAPATGLLTRIGEISRSAVPSGQSDSAPSDFGNWESSGVLDVSSLFVRRPSETVLLVDTQAHSLVGPPLGAPNQSLDLVEGGQLLLFSSEAHTIDSVEFPGSAEQASADTLDRSGVSVRVLQNAVAGATASIELAIPTTGLVVGRIYDVAGRSVRTIVDQSLTAGRTTLEWNGADDSGRLVPSGVYFARFETRDDRAESKIVVVR